MKHKEKVILDETIVELDSEDFNVQDPLSSLNLTMINEQTNEIEFRNYSFDELRSKQNNKTNKYNLRTQQNQAKNEKCHFSIIQIQYTDFSIYIIKCFLTKNLARSPPKNKN